MMFSIRAHTSQFPKSIVPLILGFCSTLLVVLNLALLECSARFGDELLTRRYALQGESSHTETPGRLGGGLWPTQNLARPQ